MENEVHFPSTPPQPTTFFFPSCRDLLALTEMLHEWLGADCQVILPALPHQGQWPHSLPDEHLTLDRKRGAVIHMR